jgi:hypothetical protein
MAKGIRAPSWQRLTMARTSEGMTIKLLSDIEWLKEKLQSILHMKKQRGALETINFGMLCCPF